MKINKNQEVRSFGVISLLLLLVAGVVICYPVWNGRLSALQDRSLHRAESLAYQILESRQSSSRAPANASEVSLNHLALDQGQIGQDPWGRPYNFKFMKIPQIHQVRILVWSLGPNGIPETSETLFDSNRDEESPNFSGDDLGIMVSVK